MSDYDHSDAVISSHPTEWTVHVLGPDDVITFNTAGEAANYIADAVVSLAYLFPRDSEFAPMIRFVLSPPTGITVPEAVAG
jgi:hypothetical protein